MPEATTSARSATVSAAVRRELPALVGLAALSALALFLLVLRAHHAGRFELRFLVWNLFLAWVPLGAASMLVPLMHARRLRLAWPVLFGVWLLFLPNAPYLLTDLVHLGPVERSPLWFDVLVYGQFAFTGVLLGVASLLLVQGAVRRAYGGLVSWVVVFGACGLAGFGVYLGRFLRWNLWDVLAEPRAILAEIAPLTDPISHPRAWVVTALFGSFLAVAHLVMFGLVRTAHLLHGTVVSPD